MWNTGKLMWEGKHIGENDKKLPEYPEAFYLKLKNENLKLKNGGENRFLIEAVFLI